MMIVDWLQSFAISIAVREHQQQQDRRLETLKRVEENKETRETSGH